MHMQNASLRRAVIVSVALALALACPRQRPLRMIFNQGTYGSSANYSELHHSDFFGGVHQMSDDFVLDPDNATITTVQWWGVYRDNVAADDEFTVFVYEIYDDPGAPLSHPWYEFTSTAVEREATGGTLRWGLDDLNIYRYSIGIPDGEFEPDRPYALSIVNDTGRWAWLVNGSPAQGNNLGWSRTERYGDWSTNAIDNAFILWSNR